MFDCLEGLNEAQRAAAAHDGGALRVLAGAGTGKTTTLAARVAWLIATGTPPERLLLLTFTRRAARQMLTRAESLLGSGRTVSAAPLAGRVRGGTFHAVAHRALRRHAAKLRLPDAFSVLDPADGADVIALIREEQGHARTERRRFPGKTLLLDIYSTAVNTGHPLSAVVPRKAPWAVDFIAPISEICRAYVRRKHAAGLLDFDDLMVYWRALVQDERLGAVFAGSVDHILVDEYQDVNGMQVDVLAALCRHDPRLTVVGDDAQALYSFRAAEPRHILEFPSVFPGATTIVLGTNYRSTQAILDAANAVGADAPRGFSAVLRAARSTVAARPLLRRCADEDAEVSAVCEQILAHREAGVSLHEQAVLIRAAHHSALLELELAARRIPYVKYGGLRFIEAAHVKDLLAAYRLADNPRDVLAWFRLLQLLEAVGPATARSVVTALGLTGNGDAPASDAEIWGRWPLARAAVPEAARVSADGIVDALRSKPGERVPVHAERLRAALAPLVEVAYPAAAARLADLEAVVAASSRAARLSEVAAEHALEPPRSTSDLAGAPQLDDDWLIVSTIHSAKGLEWDVVHLLHATDGSLPSDMALQAEAGLEEERRVFYVALTRARKALHVYVPQRYHHHPRGRSDSHSWAQPSRFLTTRVRACFDEVNDVPYGPEPDAGAVAHRVGNRVTAAFDSLWS